MMVYSLQEGSGNDRVEEIIDLDEGMKVTIFYLVQRAGLR
jgi:hypothetical protein